MKTLKELYEYREMIFSLVRRELRGKYKGSLLGFLWTFINPLMQLMIYTFVFSVVLKSGIDKYYLYLFIALIPWTFFSTSLAGGARAVLGQQGMVTKIYFPREVLPIAYVTGAFVNMLYGFIAVFVVVILSGIRMYALALIYLPFIFFVEYLISLGAALLSSAITVYFRDMEHILGILSQAWMFMTPIMYSINDIPDRLRPIFRLNPMTSVISAYRDVLYYSRIPDMETLIVSLAFGIVIAVFGFLFFGSLKKGFVEEM